MIRSIFQFSGLLVGITAFVGCTSTQVAHQEWDDSYFNSGDKARIAYARQNTQSTNYPNSNQGNGSINNYPSNQQGVNNFNDQSSVNPNADQAAANYVNPEYTASGPISTNPAVQSSGTSSGSSYVTNNYYDTDNYYRSTNRSYFSPYSSMGMGFGFSPGISLGFGYRSRMGWFGPSMGISYGFGYPSYSNFGYGGGYGYGGGFGMNMGFGMGWSPYSCYSVFDPFWGFGYNPFFFNPYMGYGSYYSPYYRYGYGSPWYGNQSGGSDTRNPSVQNTNNPRTNMSGNFNPNQVGSPNASDGNYVPPSTNGRSRGDRSDPGGLPTNPNPGTNPATNPSAPARGNNDENPLFRPVPRQVTPTEATPITPRQYQPPTTPDGYSPDLQRDRNIRRADPVNPRATPTPAPSRGFDGFSTNPGTTYPETNYPSPTTSPARGDRNPQPSFNPPSQPAPERSPARGNTDGFRQNNSNDNWFRSGGNSGSRSSGGFGGGNSNFGGGGQRSSGGGGFTAPPSGGRRRGQ